MDQRYNWWYWDSVIPKKICTDAIKEAEKSGFKSGKIGGSLGDIEGTVNEEIRKNDVVWLPRMHVLECILSHYAREANVSMGWDLDLSIVSDRVQIARYEDSEHYSFHNDILRFENGLERKMTAIMQLSAPEDYEGGELEVMNEVVDHKMQGSIIVFPSFQFHRVKPVTKGVRYSAVCWISGPKFK